MVRCICQVGPLSEVWICRSWAGPAPHTSSSRGTNTCSQTENSRRSGTPCISSSINRFIVQLLYEDFFEKNTPNRKKGDYGRRPKIPPRRSLSYILLKCNKPAYSTSFSVGQGAWSTWHLPSFRAGQENVWSMPFSVSLTSHLIKTSSWKGQGSVPESGNNFSPQLVSVHYSVASLAFSFPVSPQEKKMGYFRFTLVGSSRDRI